MSKQNSFAFALLMVVTCTGVSRAQEQLLPMPFNVSVTASHPLQLAAVRNLLTLPFIDDFSDYTSVFPDAGKWMDKQAFVNGTMPLDPPSIGVVSLDGLKENGEPYDSLGFSFFSIGSADTLTSQPIALSSYTAASNVGLSFFYEGGGVGDAPNSTSFNQANYGVQYGDSLVLEFKDNTGTWQHIWAKDGSQMFHFNVDSVIYLRDPKYFHDDFQFRFRNYASRIGQYDVWNIDYVKLDANRLPGDTVATDIAIQYPPTSILKNYRAMPWNQFSAYQYLERADAQTIFVKSDYVSGGTKNTTRSMDASETVTNTPLFSQSILGDNIDPQQVKQYTFNVDSLPDFPTDSVNIATRFVVTGDGDNLQVNDTVIANQIFGNYLAYDDGTPEAVYRLLGTPAFLAQQYLINKPDTLRGIEILFAHTDVNMATNLFNLYVWKNIFTDSVLLTDEFQTPTYANQLNGFVFYRLTQPVAITDTFYIGWQQVSLQSDLKLDVGFDLNDDAQQHLFYNTTGLWTPSGFPGTVMMRPVIGKAIPIGVGVDEVKNTTDFSVFPNPVDDYLFVSGGSNQLQLDVFDLNGKLLIHQTGTHGVQTAQLTPGMYLLRITDLQHRISSIKKFVKTH